MKPRILIIAPLPPPIHGAASVSKQILDSKLIRAEYEIREVNISTSRKLSEIGRFSIAKIFRYLYSLCKLMVELILFKPELCYLAITCHGTAFLKDAPFVLLCKLFRKKIVIHQHNKGMSNDVDRPVYRRLLPSVYRNAKVILLSWRLYPDISGIVDRKDVLVCPNGIKPSAPEDFIHKANDVPHILFLSNLLIEKGVVVLLDALELLKRKGFQFVCDFIGGETKDISAARFREEVSRRGLEESVIYHGSKYGEEKRQFFEKADIFAFPTSNEAFPLVNLEAMDYRLPIVTTDVGGIPDVVLDGKNGLIVKPGDCISLSDALEKLVDNPALCVEMGRNGRDLFLSRYTEGCFERTFIDCLAVCIDENDTRTIFPYHMY